MTAVATTSSSSILEFVSSSLLTCPHCQVACFSALSLLFSAILIFIFPNQFVPTMFKEFLPLNLPALSIPFGMVTSARKSTFTTTRSQSLSINSSTELELILMMVDLANQFEGGPLCSLKNPLFAFHTDVFPKMVRILRFFSLRDNLNFLSLNGPLSDGSFKGLLKQIFSLGQAILAFKEKFFMKNFADLLSAGVIRDQVILIHQLFFIMLKYLFYDTTLFKSSLNPLLIQLDQLLYRLYSSFLEISYSTLPSLKLPVEKMVQFLHAGSKSVSGFSSADWPLEQPQNMLFFCLQDRIQAYFHVPERISRKASAPNKMASATYVPNGSQFLPTMTNDELVDPSLVESVTLYLEDKLKYYNNQLEGTMNATFNRQFGAVLMLYYLATALMDLLDRLFVVQDLRLIEEALQMIALECRKNIVEEKAYWKNKVTFDSLTMLLHSEKIDLDQFGFQLWKRTKLFVEDLESLCESIQERYNRELKESRVMVADDSRDPSMNDLNKESIGLTTIKLLLESDKNLSEPSFILTGNPMDHI